jgi:cytochrome P450
MTIATVQRFAVKDFRFSDGTLIPAGTFVCVPSYAKHFDELIYSNPNDFDPGRYALSKEHDDDNGPKFQMVSSSLEYVTWGLGRHAWCVTLPILN